MTPLAEIVHVEDLLNVIWTAFISGIGVCAVYSLAIIGFARGVDMRREGATVAAAVFFGLMLVSLAAVGALVVYGVIVMTAK